MKNEVGCELCGGAARVYCPSDRASLCWGCDHKVHGANFLVGKHSRSLLCHRCQSPTPWTSSGSKIPPCMSLCFSCLSFAGTNYGPLQSDQPPQPPQPVEPSSPDEEEGYAGYSDDDDDDDDDDQEEEEEEEVEDDDADDENQVVPWTTSSEKPADTTVSSTGREAEAEAEAEAEDEDEEEDEDEDAKTAWFSSSLLKRKRESAFLHSSHDRNTLPRL